MIVEAKDLSHLKRDVDMAVKLKATETKGEPSADDLRSIIIDAHESIHHLGVEYAYRNVSTCSLLNSRPLTNVPSESSELHPMISETPSTRIRHQGRLQVQSCAKKTPRPARLRNPVTP